MLIAIVIQSVETVRERAPVDADTGADGGEFDAGVVDFGAGAAPAEGAEGVYGVCQRVF